MNAEIVARLQSTLDGPPIVYLLLDSHGYPQSWEEIRTLFRALIQDEGLDVVSTEAHILTPDMESSSRRAKEAAELAKKLRSGGKSVLTRKK